MLSNTSRMKSIVASDEIIGGFMSIAGTQFFL